jgi:hypothetical protein
VTRVTRSLILQKRLETLSPLRNSLHIDVEIGWEEVRNSCTQPITRMAIRGAATPCPPPATAASLAAPSAIALPVDNRLQPMRRARGREGAPAAGSSGRRCPQPRRRAWASSHGRLRWPPSPLGFVRAGELGQWQDRKLLCVVYAVRGCGLELTKSCFFLFPIHMEYECTYRSIIMI